MMSHRFKKDDAVDEGGFKESDMGLIRSSLPVMYNDLQVNGIAGITAHSVDHVQLLHKMRMCMNEGGDAIKVIVSLGGLPYLQTLLHYLTIQQGLDTRAQVGALIVEGSHQAENTFSFSSPSGSIFHDCMWTLSIVCSSTSEGEAHSSSYESILPLLLQSLLPATPTLVLQHTIHAGQITGHTYTLQYYPTYRPIH
jgi:hypothetical protein